MLLRQCGVEPVFLLPPDLDEEAAIAAYRAEVAPYQITPPEYVSFLAEKKAEAAAAQLPADWADFSGLLLAGDSMFEIDGEVLGKPGTPERAIARWQQMRGKVGILYSGSALYRLENGRVIGQSVANDQAEVSFSADVSDAEIAAYVASGEPLQVAGAFTLDGLAAPFIDAISGSPSTVIGMSLPLLRQQCHELAVDFTALQHRS